MKRRLKNILKTNRFLFTIYTVLFSKLLSFISFFLKIDEKKILFVVYGGQRYDDSPKFIYEEMKKNSRFSEFQFKWAFINPEEHSDVPVQEKIKIDTFTYFKEALTSKYWVTNSSASRGLNFRKKSTKSIFFTHGMTGIKFIGNDIKYNSKGFDLFREKHDYIVLEGKKEKEIVERAWSLTDETKLLNFGLPRNDELLKKTPNEVQILKEKFSIPVDKKIILYAPTFREYSRDSNLSVLLSPPINFDKWYKELGDDYKLLLTAHYEVEKLMNIPDDHPFIINAFRYPNINDLILISDLLISDYSSIIFDYSLTEKPILSFAYDYDQYKNYRGIYEGYEKLFYTGVSKNEDELIMKIKNLDYDSNKKHSKYIKSEYFSNYGNSTEMFLNFFLEEIYE